MIHFNDILSVVGITIGVFLLCSARNLKTAKKTNFKKISVIIPMRNEEHNIGNILNDLKKQVYVPHEIVCVDDDSEDKSANIALKCGAKVIKAGTLPKGWRGKTWACQQGAENASGDVLLFLDADVRLKNTALFELMGNYNDDLCVSVQPYHKTKKAFEQLSLFFNFIQASATGMGLPFTCNKKSLFGPVLLVAKKTFDAHGGYVPVKDKVIEDYSLGKVYFGKNVCIKLYLGGDSVSYRMYPLGIKSLIEGWTKNFSTGAIQTRWWLLIAIVIYIAALTAIPFEIIANIVRFDAVRLTFYAVIYLISVMSLVFTSRKLGSFKAFTCAIYPVLLLAFHLIFFTSFVSTFILKSTTWKGRKL